jgi:hypothetical protein
VAVEHTWQLCLRGFLHIMARQLTTKTWVASPFRRACRRYSQSSCSGFTSAMITCTLLGGNR